MVIILQDRVVYDYIPGTYSWYFIGVELFLGCIYIPVPVLLYRFYRQQLRKALVVVNVRTGHGVLCCFTRTAAAYGRCPGKRIYPIPHDSSIFDENLEKVYYSGRRKAVSVSYVVRIRASDLFFFDPKN